MVLGNQNRLNQPLRLVLGDAVFNQPFDGSIEGPLFGLFLSIVGWLLCYFDSPIIYAKVFLKMLAKGGLEIRHGLEISDA